VIHNFEYETDMDGGRMTKEEIGKNIRLIMEDFSEKCALIEKEAKENGTWQMGLDSNKSLFKKAEQEAKEKLKNLMNERL